MKSCEFFSFLMILKESIKLVPKNGKLMAFVIMFFLVLYSALFLSFNYAIKSVMNEMLNNFMSSFVPDLSSFIPNPSSNFTRNTSSFMPDPTSFMPDPSSNFTPNTSSFMPELTAKLDHLKRDMFLLLVVEIAFLLAVFIISIFSTTATVLVSAMSGKDKTLSLKELCLRIVKTSKRPLITGFYIILQALGFFFLVLVLASPLLISHIHVPIPLAILLGVMGSVYYLYLCVPWQLAMVVSVVEENCYGLEALGKAAQLIKGKRLQGFMINICFNLLWLIAFQGYRMIFGDKGMVKYSTIYGMFVFGMVSLSKIFFDVAYTVLYLDCKRSCGEEIELYGSVVEYTKLPITQLVDK